METLNLLSPENLPGHLFFTGKGGVGKTSMACAVALSLADAGRRVLLVSTDPASNLGEVLGLSLDGRPRPVPGQPLLEAMNIDPVAAAAEYRERVVGPLRGVLPPSALGGIEEQFMGSCTVEIAAFDQFARLLAGSDIKHQHIIFDTAPTGHTLRLMGLAKAWESYLAEHDAAASCLGPLAGLGSQREVYEEAVRRLSDASKTLVLLVSRAQTASLREAQRASAELRQLGVANQALLLNGLFPDDGGNDPLAVAIRRRENAALVAASAFLASLPYLRRPLLPHQVLGLDGLRALLCAAPSPPLAAAAIPNLAQSSTPSSHLLAGIADELAARRQGLVMVMGKGGVGKTSLAAALALALIRRGCPVRLSTTDPAAHLAATLAGECPGLEVGRIDPAAVTEAYRDEVLGGVAANLDPSARALIEEDLRSPCTEEIAVFRAFAREVAAAQQGVVILDTAPTGHTLMLLDASRSHQREMERQSRLVHPPEAVALLPRLRDPEQTHILLTALPEATPLHEAAQLRDDLARADIAVAGWVINQCLSGLPLQHPLLLARQATEATLLDEARQLSGGRLQTLPFLAEEPCGVAGLTQLLPD